MRITGLFVLAILLPAIAYAALVNINTADATLLDTLPGIGSSKAAAIVQYRTNHGQFTRIEDIQNVSGIGPSTYAGLASFITVGDIGSSNASTTTSTATTTTTVSSSGGPVEYVPIPTLRIITGGDHTVSAGADTTFSAIVYDGKGNKRDDALVTWSFGDGMRKTGASVFHAYYDPGEYVAIVHASTSDGGDALNEVVVTAKDASIQITSVSARGIALTNNSTRTLDLSLWRLSMGGQEFKIPADTHMLAGRTILFPSQVIELPITDSASILYPSGEVAAAYSVPAGGGPASSGQPSSGATSYERVQAVEPITSATTNIHTHEEAVAAPAATTGLAAAGAALPSSPEPAPVASTRASGIFHSPWTLGFLGIVALAGGMFIFL